MRKIISFSIACFNEELNIIPTYNELNKITEKYKKKYIFEFVFSDNCSQDKTQQIISNLTKRDKRVVGVFLSRNFGHESNGQAAMDFCSGDAVIPIECDLQDPPELIPQFIKRWEEGYDIVAGIRDQSEDKSIMQVIRKTFYNVFKSISNIDIPLNSGAFSLMDRKVVNALNSLPEKYRFFRGLRAWIGFKTAYIYYDRVKRQRGKSSYSFINYFKHAERGIFGFSYLILDMIFYFGILITLLSALFLIARFSLYSLIVFIGSVLLFAISIIGKYIQVIVEETKNRPMYIVEETININKK